MDRDGVLKILREHEPELKAAGVVHLRLFGSVARNEATSTSDVDLMLDMDGSKKITLFTLGGLQVRLTEMLGVNADISMTDSMREPFRTHALHEAAVVF
jgi:predicted nucleotidyltransferase